MPNYDHNPILATGFHMIATVARIAMTKVQQSEWSKWSERKWFWKTGFRVELKTIQAFAEATIAKRVLIDSIGSALPFERTVYLLAEHVLFFKIKYCWQVHNCPGKTRIHTHFFHFFSSLGLLPYGKSSCKNCKYVVDHDVNYIQKIFITFLSVGRTTQQ